MSSKNSYILTDSDGKQKTGLINSDIQIEEDAEFIEVSGSEGEDVIEIILEEEDISEEYSFYDDYEEEEEIGIEEIEKEFQEKREKIADEAFEIEVKTEKNNIMQQYTTKYQIILFVIIATFLCAFLFRCTHYNHDLY